MVGMLLPDLTNPFFPPIVRGLEDALHDQGYTLIVGNTDNDDEREQIALQGLVGRQIDALAVATAHTAGEQRLTELSVPIVLVNRLGANDTTPAVIPDDAYGVNEAIDHLFDLGHRRIAHIAGPLDTSTGRTRAQAFEERCREAGIYDPALVVTTRAYSVEEGQAAAKRLFATQQVTAVFAANDLLAVGCLRTLREEGREVPHDVSLVGCNDVPLVDLIDPPLTTLRLPGYEMGQRAGQLLLDALDGESTDEAVVRLKPRLVVRSSTAAPSDEAARVSS